MSDPVTNVEVEDVLSSIRRLVSDDKRPSLAPKVESLSDRLVLTPALRVGEEAAEQTNEAPEIQAWSEFGVDPDDTLAQAQEKFEAVRADDEQFETGEAAHDANNEHLNAESESADVEQVEAVEHPEDEAETDSAPSEDQNVEEAAAPEPFVLETRAEPEADVSDHVEAKEPTVEDIPEAELVDGPSEAEFFASSAATLGAKIAALETVIGKTDEQWEPDDTGASDYSGTEAPAMEWDDNLASEATAAPEVESRSSIGDAPSAEDTLDEDALRDIVSDIVREELQGALGERITRNVRKLVRREIHRALAAQELD
jgi:hypothetical protein